MTLDRTDRAALDALLGDFAKSIDRIQLEEAAQVARRLPADLVARIDGMALSKSLRRLGFNRDYSARKGLIVYRRSAA